MKIEKEQRIKKVESSVKQPYEITTVDMVSQKLEVLERQRHVGLNKNRIGSYDRTIERMR